MLKKNPSQAKAGSRASIDWFRKQALSFQRINKDKIINETEDVNRMATIDQKSIGKMYMFTYDPKMKEILPYYDTFPLVFPIELYKDGFLGLNLHYLPPVTRAKLMDALYENINNKKYDSTTKLRISYQILAGAARYKYFKPCIKRYLFSHVGSPFVYVAPDEWDFALMLPTERFEKANKQTVYRDSLASVG
jgi:hypothetical protein